MNDPRHPLDQIAERAAEAAPVAILPRLLAIKDMALSMASYRRRVDDGHRMGARALGMEDIVKESAAKAGDDMGDIFVCGDISTTQAAQPQLAPAAAQAAPAASSSMLTKAAVGAALLAGGAGAGIVADKLLDGPNQPPAMVDTDTDTDTNTHFDFGIETR